MNSSQMNAFEINNEDVADVLAIMGRTDLTDKIDDIADLINVDAVINIAMCGDDLSDQINYAHAE